MEYDDYEKSSRHDKTEKLLDTMLAYGPVGLGLGLNIDVDDEAKTRLKEDITREKNNTMYR